jgi:hypothetical protein
VIDEHGALAWFDRTDLAPEALYAAIRQGRTEMG